MKLAAPLRCIAILGALAISVSGSEDRFFEERIRPVLVERCYKCHSAQSEKLKGGLHVDSIAGLLTGGDTGPAIVPGQPEKSLLIRALSYKDESLQMPPKEKLPDAAIQDFARWVGSFKKEEADLLQKKDAKSPYDFAAARKLWAFRKPTDPPLPPVRNVRWARNGIDRFVLAKLEERGLRPADEAPRAQLIRRACYDLTGLPPSAQEVERFVNDPSPDAYERLIERLLDSPRYGERWARHWLDVVRYTDSNDARGIGGEADIPESYRYRDWVVDSFNRDLPYDEFVREQFAGDLLPAPGGGFNTNGVIATGVMAIGEWGTGDADKEKMLTDIVDDQIDVTGRAFLGVTLACARCHDHKFDPIPTEDYYSLAGIFFSSRILPSPGAKTAGSPVLRIPLAAREEVEARRKRDERMAALEKEIDEKKNAEISKLATNAIEKLTAYLKAAERKNHPAVAGLTSSPTEEGLDQRVLDAWVQYLGFGEIAMLSRPVEKVLDKPGLVGWTLVGKDNPSVTINTTVRQIDYLTIKLPPRTVAVHPSPKDACVVGWKAPVSGTFSVRGRVSDVDKECGNGIEWRLQTRGSTRALLTDGAIDNGGEKTFATNADLREGDFLELLVLPKGDYSCDSTAVELVISDGEKAWNLTEDILKDPLKANPNGVWYFYDGAGQKPPDLPGDSLLLKWLVTKDPSLSDELKSALKDGKETKLAKILSDPKSDFWASARRGIDVEPAMGELADLKKNPLPMLPVTHGLQEGGVPQSAHEGIHDARIHVRGRYDRLGASVPRRFPRLLAGDDRSAITNGSGRLELARWIASADNPMTARVMVNRIWQHHFGDGIVRTPNNFGKLGTPPTHPELLDFLAHRFVESGWSLKAMHRMIMTSATYRQSSIPEKATLAGDPENLLYGRMNRRRLEAEALRDSLLTAGDRLDLASGGKAFRDLNAPRRTLYLMTIRSERSDYRALFDAADASAIVEKRITSTVAPQALFLMNSAFSLEQVKNLYDRMQRESPQKPSARIDWLYRTLFGRQPNGNEMALALKFLDGTPERWEAFAEVLLASNEFVYVD